MTRILVDYRWRGSHGIARYSSEIIPRLQATHVPFTNRLHPSSALDAVNPARLRLTKTDLLYSPGFSAGISRSRQLVTIHDLIHLRTPGPKGNLHRNYYNEIVKPIIRRTGHVITVSETSRDEIAGWLDSGSTEIHIASNAAAADFGPNGLSAKFDQPYYLYVGNLKRHKNPEVVFKAMALVKDHHLVVVTSDVDQAKMLAAVNGIHDRVTVLANIDDAKLAALYRGARALLFPSILEGFGLPALEALACHCPVVYFADCASVAEICHHGPNGVATSTDPAVWAATMQDPKSPTASQLSHITSYSWPESAKIVDDLIRSLA